MEETLERSAKEVDEAPAPLDEWEWAQLLAWVEKVLGDWERTGEKQQTIKGEKND